MRRHYTLAEESFDNFWLQKIEIARGDRLDFLCGMRGSLVVGTGASLTALEKRVVKALLAKGWKSQDIHAWVNAGRSPTVNFGRISSVKKDANQNVANEDEVAFFLEHRTSYDSQTGLNRFDDERLFRAREAMILAVNLFNSAAYKFKSEVFCVLANISWTYLLHNYYISKGVNIKNENGFSLSISEMIAREDCPISEGIKNNLIAIKKIRDKIEHHLLGSSDATWFGIFQACCLNFDKTICDLFGSRLSLSTDLSISIQFAKMNIEQLSTVSKYNLSPEIQAIDAYIADGLTPEQLNNVEFQFQVIYTLTSSSKSKSHIQFLNPDSAEGKEVHNVLAKKIVSDDEYPYKPSGVVGAVREESKMNFSPHNHVQAIRLYKIRPKNGSSQPENTNKEYCIYHKAHKDYTYSKMWVDKLVASVINPAEFAKIKATKVS